MTACIALDELRKAIDQCAAGLDTDQLVDLVGLLEASKVRATLRLQPAAPAAAPQLVDAAAMARILDVPENWIRDRGRAGDVPVVRLGHYMRFDPVAVLEALRSRRLPRLHNHQLRSLKKRIENRGVGR